MWSQRFLCLLDSANRSARPGHLILALLHVKDYRIRRQKQKEEDAMDDYLLDTSKPFPLSSSHPYGGGIDQGTTSEVHLLRDNGNNFFTKGNMPNDSAVSINTHHPRPSTAMSSKTRPKLFRPKSSGPGLPLSFSFSRSNSIASTIASRRSSKRKSKRKTMKMDKDLPPVPAVSAEHRNSAATAKSGLSVETKPPKKLLAFPPPKGPKTPSEAAQPAKTLKPPLESFPAPKPQTSPAIPAPTHQPQRSPATPSSFKFPERDRKHSLERPMSPVGDPANRESFDYREPALTALPEGAPKLSFQSSRPSSPLGNIGDMDGLRSLRGALFGIDGASDAARSSYASSGRISPFGQRSSSALGMASGRSSPWRERAERREMEKILEQEKAEREKELLEAESKAYRAAEKMESHYLREEMMRLEEKEAMRRKRIEDRVRKLKDTLDDLKKIQDEEEERQREREREEKEEEERFERELRDVVGPYDSDSPQAEDRIQQPMRAKMVDIKAKEKEQKPEPRPLYQGYRPEPVEEPASTYQPYRPEAPPAGPVKAQVKQNTPESQPARQRYSWEDD